MNSSDFMHFLFYNYDKIPVDCKEQDEHHNRSDKTDHHAVEFFSVEFFAIAFHLINYIIRCYDPDRSGWWKAVAMNGHHNTVTDIIHDIQKLSHRAIR